MRHPDLLLLPVVHDASQPAAGGRCETRWIDHIALEHARQPMKPGTTIAALTETLHILGDPTRMYTAWVLSQEELCVYEITNLLGRSHSAAPRWFHSLRQLALVRYRKVGRGADYALDNAHTARLLEERARHMEEEP